MGSPWLIGAFVVAQSIASVIAGQTGRGSSEPWYFASLAGSGWGYVLITWVWSIVWYLPDFVKILTRWCVSGDMWHYSVLSKKKMFNFQMHGGATHLGAR